MNIFILDRDMELNARYTCDKHVVKMLLEHVQLLSSAHHVTKQDTTNCYKLTHANHPCAIWVRESQDNYEWLFNYTLVLHDEYRYRYGNKTHKSVERMLSMPNINLPSKGLTPFAKCVTHEHLKAIPDVVEAYRAYYREYKRDFATWTKRDIPAWFNA